MTVSFRSKIYSSVRSPPFVPLVLLSSTPAAGAPFIVSFLSKGERVFIGVVISIVLPKGIISLRKTPLLYDRLMGLSRYASSSA